MIVNCQTNHLVLGTCCLDQVGANLLNCNFDSQLVSEVEL